ncbi:HU family DNA-binding protein, partial [Magnetovibrio blakemorei]
SLVSGDYVKISSFGCFSVRAKKKRMGRNPKTGEQAIILPRNILTFRPSSTLKLRINSKRTPGASF